MNSTKITESDLAARLRTAELQLVEGEDGTVVGRLIKKHRLQQVNDAVEADVQKQLAASDSHISLSKLEESND